MYRQTFIIYQRKKAYTKMRRSKYNQEGIGITSNVVYNLSEIEDNREPAVSFYALNTL